MKKKVKNVRLRYGGGSNLFRKIKLLLVFFFVGLLAVSASTYSQLTKLSMKFDEATVKEVFEQIEEKSEFVFFYNEDYIDVNRRVSIHVKNEKVETILDELLKGSFNSYKIYDRQIVILSPEMKEMPSGVDLKLEVLQKKEISGVVLDEKGLSLPGVAVILKGTTNGVITDADGRFTLQVPAEVKILQFTFIGFITQEVAIGDRLQFNITLKEETKEIDEVVVVGYGTQKKASSVGAIVQTTSEELKRTGGVTNLATALTGQLAGVTVVQSSGEPGLDDPKIYIRGMGTWNNAQPLVLVDGIERQMNEVDVNEVESVSVLKDASATAVFGVKGAEGVILITTKRGQLGKPVISVDASVSTKTISRMPEKLNSYDQFQYRNDAVEYQLNRGGVDAGWIDYVPYRLLQHYKQPQANGLQYLFPDVDWADEMLKSLPVSYRTNITVSGGTDFAKYFGSLSYTFDDDLIKTDKDLTNRGYKAQNSYERLNYRSNLDLNLTKRTVFTINLAGWVGTKRNNAGADASSADIFRSFQEYSPEMFPVVYPDGAYGYNPQVSTRPNPLRVANNGGVESTRNINLSTDFVLKQDLGFITKGLSTRVSVSYDNSFVTNSGINDGGQAKSLWIDPKIVEVLYQDENGSYIDANGNFNIKEGYNLLDYVEGYLKNQNANDDYEWSKGAPTYDSEVSGDVKHVERRIFYQAQVNYNRTFGNHELGALALVNREQYAVGSMFPRYREDWVGRVTYNYDNRYLFESNFAYNGSEKFDKGYRFGFFPSVAVGWMITEEQFLKNQDWLSKLKIRYTIGKTGNDNTGAVRFSYADNYALGTDRTIFNGSKPVTSPYVQYYESVIGNPNLQWEASLKQNLGFEVGILKNKIGFNLDLFQDQRSKVFLSASQRTLPTYFGADPVAGNIGETEVKGYEMELSFKNTFHNGLYAYATMSHTGAFDKITYREDAPLLPAYQKMEGYAINQIRTPLDAGYTNDWNEVYSATGFASGNTQRTPGEYRIIDFNGDGAIDAADSAPYSYPQDRPQHTYGFNFGGEYKGFSLNVQFYGVYNVTREYTWMHAPFSNLLRTGPVFEAFTDTWTPDNLDAQYRAISTQMSAVQSMGTYMYEDGSYIRLKTAEIGYTMANVKKIMGVSSVRFYLNGNNLFLWSKTVDDYEGSSSGTPLYPLVRRFNLGLNVKF